MTSKSRRELTVRRPAGHPIAQLLLRLDPEVKGTIDDWSQRLKVPNWAVVEAIVRATSVGEDGLPIGLDLPKPRQPSLFSEEGGTASAA